MWLLSVVTAVLCCGQTTLAQGALDSHSVYDSVQINELLLIYTRSDVDQDKTENFDDVVGHPVAMASADLQSFTHELIKWALGYEPRFEFARATLSAKTANNYTWTIEWRLFPSEGAATGIPYNMRAILTGKGRMVRPRAYLWNAYRLQNGPYIRCTIAVADCRVDSEKARCHGEEILRRAKEALADYAKGDLLKVKERNSEVQIPDWRLHSLHLIDRFPGDIKIWEVHFLDASRPAIATSVNEEPHFIVWVTEDGRVGQLSMGPESLE